MMSGFKSLWFDPFGPNSERQPTPFPYALDEAVGATTTTDHVTAQPCPTTTRKISLAISGQLFQPPNHQNNTQNKTRPNGTAVLKNQPISPKKAKNTPKPQNSYQYITISAAEHPQQHQNLSTPLIIRPRYLGNRTPNKRKEKQKKKKAPSNQNISAYRRCRLHAGGEGGRICRRHSRGRSDSPRALRRIRGVLPAGHGRRVPLFEKPKKGQKNAIKGGGGGDKRNEDTMRVVLIIYSGVLRLIAVIYFFISQLEGYPGRTV